MADTTGNTTVDALTMGELVLDELASRIPSPAEATTLSGAAAGMFTGRARDLHRGFIHARAGPSVIAPVVLVRPLVELAILVRWIQDDPGPRFEAWVAHSEAQDAKAIRELAKHLPRPEGDRFGSTAVEPVLDAKEARVDAARTATGRATGALRPGLTEMIEAIIAKDPREALALRQAYDLGYRSTSPSTHTESASFKENFVEHPNGSVSYAEASPIGIELLRYMAAACLAYAVEAAGRIADLTDVAETALAIRVGLAQPPA